MVWKSSEPYRLPNIYTDVSTRVQDYARTGSDCRGLNVQLGRDTYLTWRLIMVAHPTTKRAISVIRLLEIFDI